MNRTLIVIDMQNDFVNGVLGTPEAKAIVPNVKKKIEQYVAAGHDIIYTRDTHDEGYLETNEGRHLPVPHCIDGTHGWEIVDGLYVDGSDVFNKHTFGWTNWWTFNGITGFKSGDEIEIVGVCTDICVVSNALIMRAGLPKVNITVDASCCAGTTPENHLAALQVMKSCHINITNE